MSSLAVRFFGLIENFPKPLSMLIVVTVYSTSQVVMFPGTPINIASGFLTGFWLGSLASVIGCQLGAMLCFILGRTLLRKWVENKTKTNEKFRMIDEAIASGKQARLIIFLVRLSPFFPFALCSFFFSVTKIKFVTYSVMTFLGLLPFTITYTYFGSLMKDISEIATKKVNPTFSIIVLVVGAVSVVAISVIIGKIIKNIIRKAGEQAGSNSNDAGNGETLRDKVLGDAVYIEMLDDVDSLSADDEYAVKLAGPSVKQSTGDTKNNKRSTSTNTPAIDDKDGNEDELSDRTSDEPQSDTTTIPILAKDTSAPL